MITHKFITGKKIGVIAVVIVALTQFGSKYWSSDEAQVGVVVQTSQDLTIVKENNNKGFMKLIYFVIKKYEDEAIMGMLNIQPKF